MNLKRRVMLLSAATTVIPLLVTLAASFVFILVSTFVFDTEISFENIKRLTNTHYEMFQADGSIFREDPDKLAEKEYQEYVVSKFAGIHADIIVLRKNNVLFSTKKMTKIDIEKSIQAGNDKLFYNSVVLGGDSYLVKVFPLVFRNGDEGKTILLALQGKEGPAFEKFLLFIAAVFLLSLLGTNIAASYSFSTRMLKPLSRLQTAAEEISRGNLDHEVVEEGDAEIKKLCSSFEQMRIKLKESVQTQVKYDDNRKMLVSSISHDLKTPMTSIKGYVEGIMDGVANTPEKVEKYLKTVYSKAVQVDAMIDDLLLYSKLDLNQIPFHFEETDIIKYFQDCVAESEPELEKSNIAIRFQNGLRQRTLVKMDRDRMKRVVMNIVDNAKKYMDKPQGEIRVILRESGTSVIVEIRDNGSGIAKEDVRYVFDRFYRADAARSQKSGSGLGLAIARQIIEGHGGKIWVRSRENEGTSIMMSLKKMEAENEKHTDR